MLNDTELIGYLRRVAKTANSAHRCTPWNCGDSVQRTTRYAGGTPPHGWHGKAAALAAENGWKIGYTPLPLALAGPGTDGGTTGAYMPDFPELARTVMMVPGQSPGKEFFTTCHELAHVLLRHAADTREQFEREAATRALNDAPENFHHEVSAQLAAIGATRSAGLTVGQPAVCYLAKRVAGHGKTIGENEILAGFQAGRILRDRL